MLPITWIQGNKPNDDFIKRSRSSRFFTRAYIIDANTAIVSNIQIYWYSFMHNTLRLLVFSGNGQNHITNKLSFTTAVAFFSVIFSCMTPLWITYKSKNILRMLLLIGSHFSYFRTIDNSGTYTWNIGIRIS